MREKLPATPIGRVHRILRRLIPLSLFTFACAVPATAQERPDLWVTVFSEPGKDRVAVAYRDKAPAQRIKQDFAEIARNLGTGSPTVKITNTDGIPAAEAEFNGLTDWSTGAINLDPLIQTYKRYGRFGAGFFFLGNFPLQPVENFQRGPLRVEVERAGSGVRYLISIDQSQGVPSTVPTVAAQREPDRRWIWGVGALSAVVAVTVFLVVFVLMGQRRKQAAAVPERPAGSPGSAASSGSPGEGK